jgi:2-oxoglutarate dehydrogenase complex dehydrogenase (E1) component-like enzyme
MHLRIVQRQLTSIQNCLRRTYKHQTNVFGYDPQLKTVGNTEETEKILRNINHIDYEIVFLYQYIDDYHQARQANPHAALLIDAYRKHGHRLAKIDPLGINVNT